MSTALYLLNKKHINPIKSLIDIKINDSSLRLNWINYDYFKYENYYVILANKSEVLYYRRLLSPTRVNISIKDYENQIALVICGVKYNNHTQDLIVLNGGNIISDNNSLYNYVLETYKYSKVSLEEIFELMDLNYNIPVIELNLIENDKNSIIFSK